MKIGTINGAKRFTAVLLSIFILVPVVVLPANAEIIDKETSLTTNEVKFKEVSLGEWHSAAITTDGSLYTWGYNPYCQLRDGTTEDRYTPTKIMDDVVSVSLGYDHSAAITSDGSLYTWGKNQYGQLGDGTKVGKLVPTKITVVSETVEGETDYTEADYNEDLTRILKNGSMI